MPNELKPFIHIVYHLYTKYGFTEYPLCKQERIKIDVKDITKYVSDYIMRLQTDSRS
jgi:hypothetical protein